MKFAVNVHTPHAHDRASLGIIEAPNPQAAAASLGLKIMHKNEETGFYSAEGLPLPGRTKIEDGSFIWLEVLPELRTAHDLKKAFRKHLKG